MKRENLLLLSVLVLALALAIVDRIYVSTLRETFSELERERIEVSNKLATAKIVTENLNHVRDLVFTNMAFGDDGGTPAHESVFFDFLTTCVRDLKIKLVSVKPVPSRTEGNVTTIAYDIRLEGDFFSFGELCAKFENSRRIIAVEDFKIERRAEAVGGTRRRGRYEDIDISMRVNTYRIRKG